MSVDIGDDLAVTSFARREVGCTWHDRHVLARRQGQWVLLGGGGGTSGDHEESLADRPRELVEWSTPQQVRAARAPAIVASSGGVDDCCGRSVRWPSRGGG